MVATTDSGNNEKERIAVTQKPATLGAALQLCHRRLESAELFFGHGTDNAWDEAVQLVLGALDLPLDSDEDVLSRALVPGEWSTIARLLESRERGEPLAYLLGRAWYAGLEFLCDRRALVPRSPLAETIAGDFAPWWQGEPPHRILDLCCGGGCIGIAAAHYVSQARVLLADLDDAALELARENIALHGVESRVEACHSDMFCELAPERFDIILCNPPYVERADMESLPGEYRAEPEHALAAGEDGLDLALPMLRDAPDWMSEQGLLFLELGNSWSALDALCGSLPLTWVEFSRGGHGVLVATSQELREWQEHFGKLAASRPAGSV